jgi:hypothetical protein
VRANARNRLCKKSIVYLQPLKCVGENRAVPPGLDCFLLLFPTLKRSVVSRQLSAPRKSQTRGRDCGEMAETVVR